MKIFCRSLVILLCVFVTAGCVDFFDPNSDENKTDVSSGYGSAYDILEERGEHTLFLEAVDLTGYASLLQGSGLVTVFAPRDDMFATYIAGKFGVMSVEDVPIDDLTTLVAFHLVQFSFSPVDLLSFSMNSNAVVPEYGDGSCYKYLTYSREAVERVTSYTGYEYDVFSREKYIPILSSELLKNRGLADPQADYELLFPEAWWAGLDDQLYVGNAVVEESGIQALNGYLYIIDNVATPLNTIYEELHNDWAAEYTVFRDLCDRVSYFEYSSDLTDVYAAFGDSLYLHYSWMAPVVGIDGSEIAEVASEWTAHIDDDYDTRMKYSVHCLVPTDRYLEPYILDKFSQYFEKTGTDDFVDKLPRHIVFHLLRTFMFDKRELIFPSELTGSEGIYGNNGETFIINEDDIQDVKMCSNGVIYGLDALIENAVFQSLIDPIMTSPDYEYYANALTADDTYIQTANLENEFTIFLRSDDDMLSTSGRFFDDSEDPLNPNFGTYAFMYGTTVEDLDDVSLALKNSMVYGGVEGVTPVYDGLPSDTDEDLTRYRYYRTIGWTSSGSYFYTYNGDIYDGQDFPLVISNTYEGVNGNVFQVDRELNASISTPLTILDANTAMSTFSGILTTLSLRTSFNTLAANSMVFIPSNDALAEGIAAGNVPYMDIVASSTSVDGELDSIIYTYTTVTELAELTDYVRFHFISTVTNSMSTVYLPSYGPSGHSDDSFSESLITSITYRTESEIERMIVGWDLEDPNVLTVTDYAGGNEIKTTMAGTSLVPALFTTTGVIYLLDGCFDYRSMYQYK